MTTPDFPAVRDYHERTKLYPGASQTRRVDAALVPKQYKRYVDLPSFALPAPARRGRTLFEVLDEASSPAEPLTLASVSAVLHYAAGIVRRRTVGGRELAFRAASCTGALYHVEIYLVCGGLEGLEAGVYHYDVLDESLRIMRPEDYRAALAAACCDDAVAQAGASVILTSTFWRNAWRYEERAYRHVFWDGGTLLANLLAVSTAHDLAPTLYTGFVDSEVNALLDLDAHREASVAVVSLGVGAPGVDSPPGAPLGLPTEPLSRAEIEYPLIWQTHAATALPDRSAVEAWRRLGEKPRGPGVHSSWPQAISLEESIERRGSTRRFSGDPLPRDAFEALIATALSQHQSDFDAAASACRLLLIVNRVEGMEPGAYSVDARGRPSLLRAGDFAAQASHLALDQEAAGSAGVNLYFVTTWDDIARLGGRSYRAVQLEAGIRTGHVYLAAASLGLKASGLTFYDDKVASFFGLDPQDTVILMLVAAGL